MLATVLGHPKTQRSTLSKALSIYDSIRRPFSQGVQEASSRNGRYFTLSKVDGQDTELERLGDKIKSNWQWTWTTSLDPSVREAVDLLAAM